MQTETKEEILERRKEIENEIVEMLVETESDFGLEDVKEAIFDEEEQDDFMQVVAMFDPGSRAQGVHYGASRGGDASELSNVLELVMDAWNYPSSRTEFATGQVSRTKSSAEFPQPNKV